MNQTTHHEQHPQPPQPKPERGTGHLPNALTFFMTRDQRTRVLRALRTHHDERTRALLIALGLRDHSSAEQGVRR